MRGRRPHCEHRTAEGVECGDPATHVVAYRDPATEGAQFGPELVLTFVCEHDIGNGVPRGAVGASVRWLDNEPIT